MNEQDEPQASSDVELSEATKVLTDLRIPSALVRTALSAEQSLMSWIRTSLSLFTFGFTITQFFHYLQEQQEGTDISTGPQRLGVTLICVGILVLLLAMVEYVMRLRRMKEEGLPPDSSSFLPIGTAVALLAMGIAALVSVTLNWSL